MFILIFSLKIQIIEKWYQIIPHSHTYTWYSCLTGGSGGSGGGGSGGGGSGGSGGTGGKWIRFLYFDFQGKYGKVLSFKCLLYINYRLQVLSSIMFTFIKISFWQMRV